MSKVMDLIIENTKEQISQVIGFSGLGGRICYSSSSVDEIIKSDNRVSNGEQLINYLAKLISKGHLSIFEHSVFSIGKKELAKVLMNTLTLHDLITEISPKLRFLFDVVGYDLIQPFPVLQPDKEIEGYYIGAVLALKKLFHILPYTENVIYINLRHVLEYKYNELKDWKKVAEWFVDFYRDYVISDYNVDLFQSILTKEINNGQGKVTIFKLYYEDYKKVVGVTFVLEGVSRVLTHQLVRHRLFCSYSQRSHRYTKINGINEFVYPPLDYIRLKTIRSKFIKEFEHTYKFTLEEYEKLIHGIEHKDELFKIRKEDARFIIPGGVKTTIMITMLTDGFFNFLHERTNNHAQWEIREVAQILSNLVKGEIV